MLRNLVVPPPSVTPVCPYFSTCGGCDSQDIAYTDQLAAKETWLSDLFAPLHPEQTLPIIGSPKEYPTFFRNKIRFSFIEHEGKIWPSRHAKGSTAADIAVDHCYLQSEEANKIINITARIAQEYNWTPYSPMTGGGWFKHLLIRQGKATGDLMVSLISDRGEIPGLEAWREALLAEVPLTSLYQSTGSGKSVEQLTDIHLWGKERIEEKVGDYTFAISPQAFFQTNSEMIETLYDTIRERSGSGEVVWDLYAGSATIGSYVHDQFKKVVSIEANPANIADAQINLERNQIHNLELIEGKVEDILTSAFIREHGLPDCIILDPPRAGLHASLRTLLSGLKAPRLVYVSCNPVTAARDIAELQGAYHLTSLQAVDMFPHSWHAEMIAVLERK